MGGGGAAGRRCVRLVGGQWALYVAELTLARAGGGEDKKARSPGHRRRRTLEQGRPPTGVQRRVSPKHKPWCAGGWGSLRICTLRAIGVWEVGGELRHTCLQTSRYRALCTLRAGPLWARQMGIPTSVSIGSMVNLPPTARSEDYVGACNCKYLSREKPRNRYMRYPCPEIIISLLIPPAPCAHCDTSAPCAPCDTLLNLCASDCALVSCAHYLTRAPATSRARARPTTDGRP